jgi:uncharacterized membrane protein
VDQSESQIPLLVMVIFGALAVSWVLRKLAPAMNPFRRLLYTLAGGVVLGGVLFGVLFNR